MKTNRLFAAAAILGAMAFTTPMLAHAEDHSVESGAKEMYQGAKQDVKNAGVTAKIKTALAANPITKGYTIHVDTDDAGVVTLSGDVPNMSVSKEAERIAKNTEHVTSVRNELKLQNASAQ